MLKYTIEFNDIRVEIDSPTYTDTPISLIPADTPLTKEYSGNSDDNPFLTHLIPSTITMNVVSTGLDLDELMLVNDASFKCRVYIGGVLDWQGYLISDGVQEHDSGVPYDVTIKAIDGVQLLENTTYNWVDNYPSIIVNGITSARRMLMNFIRIALYPSVNIDNRLPIRWNTKLKSKQYPNSDMVAGLNVLSNQGDLLNHSDKNTLWYIENIAKACQSWLYQKGGHWYFTNYFDTLSGNYNGYQITSDTTAIQTATAYNANELQQIAMSDTINESWWWTAKKPLGSVSVKYNSLTVDNNVIPNASFDDTIFGAPIYWRLASGNNAKISSTEPLNTEYTGHSIQVDNTGIGTSDVLTFGSIPMDSNVLFKYADLGFIINPVSGYATDSEQEITFGQIRAIVKYTGYQNGVLKNLYLNEFGYWSGFGLVGDGLHIVDYVASDDKVEVFFGGASSRIGQDFYIQYTENTPNIPPINIETGHIFTAVTNLADSMVAIATASGGVPTANSVYYYVEYPSDVNTYITGGADEIKYIDFLIPNLKQGDITSVQFQSKGNSQGIKVPDCGVIDPNMVLDAGRLSVEMFIPAGVVVQFDDLYFRVSDDKDVYELKVPGSKNSQESYEMGVSSSFSGHMISNIMDGYADSNKALFWNDNKSLTELYGERVLNWRNVPRRIFSGQIDKIVEWGLFELKGKKYAPLSISTDYARKISTVTGIEIGENILEYEVTHKSSGAN